MNQHSWQGHKIDVRFCLERTAAWLAGGFVVLVDGTDEFRAPMEFERGRTSTHFTIEYDGRIVDGLVRSVGRVLARGTAYEVLVDGTLIGTGKVRAEYWLVLYAGLAAILLVLLACLFPVMLLMLLCLTE
jgi:hypothetical protein